MKRDEKLEILFTKVATTDRHGKEISHSYGLTVTVDQEKDIYILGMELEEMSSLTTSKILDEVEQFCPESYMASIFHNNGFYLNDEWQEV